MIDRFSVEWTGKEGLDIDTHKEYIKEFCDHFDKSIKRLVDDAVKKNDELMTDRIYADILQVYFGITLFMLICVYMKLWLILWIDFRVNMSSWSFFLLYWFLHEN